MKKIDPTLERALSLLLRRGRAYNVGKSGAYVSVKVFSTVERPLFDLSAAFGGSVYKHKGGWIWVLSDDASLAAMATMLAGNARNKSYIALQPLFQKYGYLPELSASLLVA